MTMRLFNITDFIKASMILILSLMLNMSLITDSNASNPRPVTTMGAYAPTYQEAASKSNNVYLEATEIDSTDECSVTVFRAQHSVGCWPCLVFERLTSAFLNAAKHGLPITQKVGVGLLILGTILWLLKWGLDNVSSFSEIQLPNIMNTLFVMCFKVLLAYWFITLSSTAIGEYFVRPIMSVGAVIGQNMWAPEIDEQTETWEDSDASLQKIEYTGPTNIVPKSIMKSLLGAMNTITNTTAENMVLGKMIMCYSALEDGGAWKVKYHFVFPPAVIPNIFTWLQGLAIFIMGFALTAAIAYYFLDISFKLGFCVLAMPITAGLWPFKMTESKLMTVVSIMMKASASFAFMALMTYFGMALVSEALNNLEELYTEIEKVSKGASDEELDLLNDNIKSVIGLFSAPFILMMFTMFYFFKLVSETVGKVTDSFFPDKTFGGENPMHTAATGATSYAYNLAKKASGVNLAKDIIKNQAGQGVKNLAKGVGNKMGKGVSNIAKGVVNGFRGKK